jgi:D-amino peptidase
LTLIRGHSGHPFGILQEIDSTFDAVVLLGAHAGAGMNYSNLEHTINDEEVSYMSINGLIASEFLIQAYTAEYVRVPIIFVAGDSGICDFINDNFSKIKTVASKKCVGNSTISMNSVKINDSIKGILKESLNEELSQYRIVLPKDFSVEIQFIHQHSAYKNSFYPGMKTKDPKTLLFHSNDFFEVLRMMQFVLW